jgi:hypothetical protein
MAYFKNLEERKLGIVMATVGEWTGLIGALTGLLAVTWQVYVYWSQKGRLEVFVFLHRYGYQDKPDELNYHVFMRNVGNKSVIAVGWNFDCNDKVSFGFGMRANGYPRELIPGESKTDIKPYSTLLDEGVKKFYVTDGKGNRHFASRKSIKALNKELLELQQEERG